jgi:methylated-DNA-protein-cysteine methyltransferase-like protein
MMPAFPADEMAQATDATIREKIFELVRAIAPGRVSSYGALGAACDPPISGYICGRILQNVPGDVPWWRVVSKDGALPISKRSPHLAADQKQKLEDEGVEFSADGKIDMSRFAL